MPFSAMRAARRFSADPPRGRLADADRDVAEAARPAVPRSSEMRRRSAANGRGNERARFGAQSGSGRKAYPFALPELPNARGIMASPGPFGAETRSSRKCGMRPHRRRERKLLDGNRFPLPRVPRASDVRDGAAPAISCSAMRQFDGLPASAGEIMKPSDRGDAGTDESPRCRERVCSGNSALAADISK